MSTPLAPLILASRSPRRRELLREAGYAFQVIPPGEHAESELDFCEPPAEMVSRLAIQKAADVAVRVERGLVLGCDTVAECQGQILGKPRDVSHARQMLQVLRGQEHRVYSGLCLWSRPDDRHVTEVAVTVLQMLAISDWQLKQYLNSGLWQGKAGAFGYQDGHDWLQVIAGSESNVVGLPLELLAEMIDAWNAE
jgi:septum formation protein